MLLDFTLLVKFKGHFHENTETVTKHSITESIRFACESFILIQIIEKNQLNCTIP